MLPVLVLDVAFEPVPFETLEPVPALELFHYIGFRVRDQYVLVGGERGIGHGRNQRGIDGLY